MPRPGLLGSYIPCWVLLRSRAPWRMLLCLMYRGLGGADLGSNWVYPRCTIAPVHHLIPNKQMGVFPSSKTGASGCGRRAVKRPQAGKEVKEEAVVPMSTLTLTSTSTTLVSTLTPRRKERIKGMKQRDKVMLTGKKKIFKLHAEGSFIVGQTKRFWKKCPPKGIFYLVQNLLFIIFQKKSLSSSKYSFSSWSNPGAVSLGGGTNPR